jgi:predicted  nucleic acid-binding Zn ribbon protein
MGNDAYYRLKPPPPTPADEVCSCAEPQPLKLMFALGYNPIHCMACNLEVPPETYRPDESLCEAIAFWRELYRALYMLWLDSGDYEEWAKAQLADMSGRVNQDGMELRARLETLRRTYYWFFQEQSDDSEAITSCPVCRRLLEESPLGTFKQMVCETCSIVTVG